MSGLSFIKQYVTKPRTVGAVWPSSKYLAAKMVADIDFETADTIVEYGPGTGVFTDKILKARNPETKVLLLEFNPEFCALLDEKYKGQPNLYIVNDSAAEVGKYLGQYDIKLADYIISGLPFASLPLEVSSRILSETKKCLISGGKFITFQYTLLRKGFIEEYFSEIGIKRELRNIPPAYVFSCGNEPEVIQ